MVIEFQGKVVTKKWIYYQTSSSWSWVYTTILDETW